MKNETGFDRFSETHFVGKEDTRGNAGSDFLHDGDLMGDQINPTTQHSAYGRLADLAAAKKRFGAEVELS